MTLVEVLFLLLGAMALGSAVLVAVSANLVHCALWLVVTLGALAGCYLLLAAEFVAWVQVLIYLGAVVVLLLFALMLTRAPTGAVPDLTSSNRFLAAFTAAAASGLLIVSFAAGFGGTRIEIGSGDIGSAGALGSTLFGAWVLGFEVLSVLLLAALIGAIVLSRRQERD
ncbi:MAG: NADH-quinone oxidoreductase subunit J [Nocardioidaceae bacterium]|nr:NADH-quinone oxidoreductase subunit J [Nocardioidaceae bacterium]